MIYSMTCYGNEFKLNKKTRIDVEVKSLNSKNADIQLKIPAKFKSKEMELRSYINSKLIRGKIELNVNISSRDDDNSFIDEEKVENYFKSFSRFDKLSKKNIEYLKIILQLPGILKNVNEICDEDEWKDIMWAVGNAIKKSIEFRKIEGEIIENVIKNHLKSISKEVEKINKKLLSRNNKKRNDLLLKVKELNNLVSYDEVRFEQEILYYIEKYDISEELDRLKGHCEHFIFTVNNDYPNGKKLGFILQEMFREINTMGVKSNYFDIQMSVIQIKDDIEKIKEQIYNIL